MSVFFMGKNDVLKRVNENLKNYRNEKEFLQFIFV
ncbi:hypothetical protein BCE_3192 [Bacillus cereus ATCC 10987]|uniref:Uncharacterized protein n=1 Tax=Bacillus cereus (strain ATCC 10987 / NRS 248) TaxID=222523 RepID=Q735G0_BACC1|nr:hypothetical protein BCE_3192 [Bacillus cereus ATCC 10987]